MRHGSPPHGDFLDTVACRVPPCDIQSIGEVPAPPVGEPRTREVGSEPAATLKGYIVHPQPRCGGNAPAFASSWAACPSRAGHPRPRRYNGYHDGRLATVTLGRASYSLASVWKNKSNNHHDDMAQF